MNGAAAARIEDLLRPLAPQVLGALVRRHGQFDLCEDAVQEALLAASSQWVERGVPDNPRGWLITVADRRMIDLIRSESARRRREDVGWRAGSSAGDPSAFDGTDPAADNDADDTLTLLFLCCHPAVSPASQVALTLRAVGGLSTAEIARCFLVPEATMAQRISRAKQSIRSAGARFELPPTPERSDRLGVVLHVLYLIFNEGYTSSGGAALQRADLTIEAIRLTRALRALIPDDPEVAGLLALMLLNDARRAARTTPDGALIALDDQDRALWDRASIDEGVDLLTTTLESPGPLGPYQLQAAIAAVHDEALTPADTDWLQILALYDLLQQVSPNPIAALNRLVAVAQVHGPRTALDDLDSLIDDDRLAGHHRVEVVRAHLLEMEGDLAGARTSYRAAARRTTSTPERRYLDARAARLER